MITESTRKQTSNVKGQPLFIERQKSLATIEFPDLELIFIERPCSLQRPVYIFFSFSVLQATNSFAFISYFLSFCISATRIFIGFGWNKLINTECFCTKMSFYNLCETKATKFLDFCADFAQNRSYNFFVIC